MLILAPQFALKSHHCNFQVLVALLHLVELSRQLIVLRDSLF